MKTFEQFLTSENIHLPISNFLLNLIIGTVMAYILTIVYVKLGKSLSNRKSFANHFYLIVLTTLFIITIVKSSLALSLGLVGALSIVRFRTAIKEPEELAYLFCSIAIGIGLGANQITLTCVAFVFIMLILIVKSLLSKSKSSEHKLLVIESDKNITIDDIVKLFEPLCKTLHLKRVEKTDNSTHLSFIIEFNNASALTDGFNVLNEQPLVRNYSLFDSAGFPI